MPLHLINSDLKDHLKEQIQFLIFSSKSYDNGFYGEAKRMAISLRILLHDTSKSHSLLAQLNKKSIKFYNLAHPYNKKNLLTTMSLISIKTKVDGTEGEVTYEPLLDNWIPQKRQISKIDFNAWWNQTVIKDKEKNKFSRKDLILQVSNTDGGAHIDPELDDRYAALSRFNSLGWETVFNGKVLGFKNKPELASIRQITHEVLKTLQDEFPDFFDG